MDISFKKIRYRNDGIGNLVMVFLDQKNVRTLYHGGAFSPGNADVSREGENWLTYEIHGRVIGIRETEDWDYLLQLADGVLIKIQYLPNDRYRHGVERRMPVAYHTSPWHTDFQKRYDQATDYEP